MIVHRLFLTRSAPALLLLLLACVSTNSSMSPDYPLPPAKPLDAFAFGEGAPAIALNALKKSTGGVIQGAGWAVDLTENSSKVLLTAPYHPVGDSAGNSIGEAWILSPGQAHPVATFAALDATDLLYGAGAAISGDGSLVVIGAPGITPSDRGVVYFYAVSSDNSSDKKPPYNLQTAAFRYQGDPGSYFGISVDVDHDGSTVVVGAPGENKAGTATVFTVPGGDWKALREAGGAPKETTLPDVATFGDEFGRSVAISGDGSVIVVGIPGGESHAGAFDGGIYVFLKDGNTWTTANHGLPIGPGDLDAYSSIRFGESVAVSYDGSFIAVGAEDAFDGAGAAYVVSPSDSGYYDLRRLGSSDWVDGLGLSVAMSADGSTIAAGAYGNDNKNGFVVVYQRTFYDWSNSKVRLLTPAFNTNSNLRDMLYGFAVALSADGAILEIGAPGYGNGSGHVFTSDLTSPPNG